MSTASELPAPEGPEEAPIDPATFGLEGAGADLFAEMTERYDFRPDELAVFVNACHTLTLCERLERAARTAEPVVLGSQRQPVANPLFGELRMQRTTFAALMGKLSFPEVDDETGEVRDLAMARTLSARHAARARWSR